MGSWWFKEIPMEELVAKKETLFKLKTGIHNEKDLA
jgi:hypothetical protein